jgi:hypothetical protein
VRFDNFRVIAASCGTDHKDVRTGNVVGVMAFVNFRAKIR